MIKKSVWEYFVSVFFFKGKKIKGRMSCFIKIMFNLRYKGCLIILLSYM